MVDVIKCQSQLKGTFQKLWTFVGHPGDGVHPMRRWTPRSTTHVEVLFQNGCRDSFLANQNNLLINLLREVIAQFSQKCRHDGITLEQFAVELVDFIPADFNVDGLDNYRTHHAAFHLMKGGMRAPLIFKDT